MNENMFKKLKVFKNGLNHCSISNLKVGFLHFVNGIRMSC